MREWRNTFHTNFYRIGQLGDDLICLVVTAGFREGLLISGFQLLQVQGSYGPHRLQVQTTSGRMFPLAAACSRHAHQLQIRPAYGLDGRAVIC